LVSWLSIKIKVDRFSCLGIKTGSSDLVIWVSKSPRRFLGLGIRTTRATVCRLRQKTDGRGTVRDTCRDLATYFTLKQVRLGFLSLPQNLWRSDGGWYTWHHHRGHVKIKSKMDGSMRCATSNSSTSTLLFS
jgi:hypothetical protein